MPIRIAVLTTVWRYLTHAQHIADRFLVGYPWEGAWHKPDAQIVSLYVDQKPEGDQSGDRARAFGFTVYETVADALRCGGDSLAVDAILLIGEHGDYPVSDLGQILYPRHELFMQCVAVFERDGRSVPIFNDKHLSYSFEKARAMVDSARRLGFGLLAGSSLPVTWRLPALELPLGCALDEALMVGVGPSDAMDYHALEAMQCMVERRAGGEVGVASVQLLDGDAVWAAGDAGRWSWELLESALSRSDSPLGLSEQDSRTQDLVGSGEVKRLAQKPAAYCITYRDGFQATLLMLDGVVRDYNFAARLAGQSEPSSCQFFLPPVPPVTYSACLVHHIETLFTTGVAPYPAERTLLVCGVLEACLRSRAAGNFRLETPHLGVAYTPPPGPLFPVA